ncbi:hypothetical protein [Planctomyces sp. SH-PL14]|uniref:hypothetical protein n=1 Tax=Planctomyces sp. SH-PL14 TaxID=1632864 RepID=UPI00078E7BE7|nr:hypothetical protein [Planctomyces sp. SH-PL14]AMV21745.1 hypothetical protein VT03_27840 [Planctomyces sp. SH-PL14]
MRKSHAAITVLLLVAITAGVVWSRQRPPTRRLMCTMKLIQDGGRHYAICVIEPEAED